VAGRQRCFHAIKERRASMGNSLDARSQLRRLLLASGQVDQMLDVEVEIERQLRNRIQDGL
jgi:hypothetical protein